MARTLALFIVGLLSIHQGQGFTLSASSSPTNEDIQELVNMIEHVKRDSVASIGQLQRDSVSNHEKLQNELKQLKREMLPPVGSTYVQYGGQKAPSEIWPAAEWGNVSKTYAGLFFRAEGGSAGSFGKTQGSQVPLARKTFWKWVATGGHNSSLKFKLRTENVEFVKEITKGVGDVRPANQAVRIWVRTK